MKGAPFAIWCRRIGRRWVAHRHTDNAAALAFYSLISLVPMLLFGVTIAGLILGERSAHGELEHQLTRVVGEEPAKMIDGMLTGARIAPASNPSAFCVAMITLLYSGTHVLAKLREALNMVFGGGIQEPRRSWISRMVARAVSASLILIFGAILVAATAMEGVASYVTSHMSSEWFDRYEVLHDYRWLSTYMLLCVAFFVILKVLPRHRPNWGYALIGGAFGAVVVGSLNRVLEGFMRHTLWASFVGSGFTVLIFLFWLFFSIQAFLIGAELAAWLERRAKRRERLAKSEQ